MSLKLAMKEVYYLNEIKRIKILLENYYNKLSNTGEEEYETNKSNKEQIKTLIIETENDRSLCEYEKQKIIEKALYLLAKNTGCVQDEEIAEDILDKLFYEMKILNQKDIEYYYILNSTGRWK